MNYNQLRYFVTVAENLNFTKAAERLYITQPGLSRQISNLEQELGVALFHRDKRSISLSEAGEQLLREAYAMISEHDRVVCTIRENRPEKDIKLVIGYSGWLEPSYFHDFLAEFVENNKDIAIYLRKSNLVENFEMLREHTIDIMLGLFSGDENLSGLCVNYVVPIHTVFVTRKDHPLAGRASVCLPDIQDETYIALTRAPRPFAIDTFNSYFTKGGVIANVSRYVDERMDYFNLIKAGVGVGLTCSLFTHPGPDCAQLAFTPVRDHRIFRYYAAWNEDNGSCAIGRLCRQINAFFAGKTAKATDA